MHIVRRPKDLLGGLFFFVVGTFAVSVAVHYPLGSLRNMGPGYFPIIVASLLGFVGLILTARSFAGSREDGPALELWPLTIVFTGVFVFALILLGAGLFIAIVALVLVVTAASRPYRPIASVLLAFGLAVSSVALFVLALGQQLPILGSWFPFRIG